MLIELSVLLVFQAVEVALTRVLPTIVRPVPAALIANLEIGKIAAGLTPDLIYPLYFSLRRTALQPGKVGFQLLALSFGHYLHATIWLVACVAAQAQRKRLTASKVPETDSLYVPMHYGA
jgi:hypothetical protein